MRAFYLATLIGLLLVAVACGGDSGSDSTEDSTAAPSATGQSATATSAPPASSAEESAPPPSSSTVQPPASADDSDDAAQMGLLTIADFPAGWTESVDEDDDDDFVFTGDCAYWNDESIPFDGTLAEAESNDFDGTDRQTVNSATTVMEDAGTADDAMNLVVSELGRCGDQLVSETRRMILEGWSENGYDTTNSFLDVSFEPYPYPALGDGSYAYRFEIVASVERLPIGAVVDMIFFRQGRMLGLYCYFSRGGDVDPVDEEFYARLFVEKVLAASETL